MQTSNYRQRKTSPEWVLRLFVQKEKLEAGTGQLVEKRAKPTSAAETEQERESLHSSRLLPLEHQKFKWLEDNGYGTQVTMGETPPCWLSTNVPQDARQQHADQHQIWAEKKAAYNDKQAIAAKHFLDTANQALQQENWETNTLGVESKLFLATNHHVFESGSQVEVWFAPRYGSQYEKVTFPLCDEQGDLWLRHVNGEDPDVALLPITMKSGELYSISGLLPEQQL